MLQQHLPGFLRVHEGCIYYHREAIASIQLDGSGMGAFPPSLAYGDTARRWLHANLEASPHPPAGLVPHGGPGASDL